MKPGAYGPFPYSPIIRRPRLQWPNGARLALWIIPNIEFFALDEQVPAAAGGSGVKAPDVPTWAVRDYGNRVGVFRLMQVMERYGIRGTVALNSNLCARHPEIIEEGQKRGWEWMGHNQTNTKRLNGVPPEEEPRIIRDALAEIERATGRRPVGWLGSGLQETWNTLDLLAENGVEYVCDWVNDDQPYLMTLEGGRRILSVPYSHDINDKPAFEHMHLTAPEFQAMICRQFDTLWREGAESGRVMAIALHPYITGVPHRIGALDGALDYICRHEGVWRATGAEIARAYLAQLQPKSA
ncbi:MAG TPA: polysaccharide deacetylase family protein [Stellaceae bacterium]|nr:polysaccharide deacetylase family protein [Stellaceae bacterium]